MFKTNFSMKSFTGILSSTLIALMFVTSTDAVAQTESVVVQVAFVAPISVGAETNALEFGSLDVAMLFNDLVTVNPDDSFSESAANILGGNQLSAKLLATATPGRPINILVDNVAAASHYTLETWLCDYAAAGQGACDGTGLVVPLSLAGPREIRIGATLRGAGGAIAGDDDTTFDLTVSYE